MSLTVKLQDPISFGSETITELTLRKPVAGDLMGVKGDRPMDDTLEILSRISGQPLSVVKLLSLDDLSAVGEKLDPFFAAFRQTGLMR